MPEVNETVAAGLAAYYEFVAEQLHKWADPLSNEQFWRKPYPYGTFDRTIAMVVATIRKQKTEDWGKAYTAEREPETADRFQIFVRCAGHAYHHVGQIVYLSRELART